MRDRPIIYTGLLVFLGLATMPFWRDLAGAATTKGPQQKLPATATTCVAGVEFMKSSHMRLLLDMRDRAVRQGIPTYAGADGKTYTIGLTSTCLEQCHGSKTEFCDRCHDYAGVSPGCWSCHVDAAHPPGAAAMTASRSPR